LGEHDDLTDRFVDIKGKLIEGKAVGPPQAE
jgi:hypothetical protein